MCVEQFDYETEPFWKGYVCSLNQACKLSQKKLSVPENHTLFCHPVKCEKVVNGHRAFIFSSSSLLFGSWVTKGVMRWKHLSPHLLPWSRHFKVLIPKPNCFCILKEKHLVVTVQHLKPPDYVLYNVLIVYANVFGYLIQMFQMVEILFWKDILLLKSSWKICLGRDIRDTFTQCLEVKGRRP